MSRFIFGVAGLRRGALTHFVVTHQTRWELAMAGLTGLYVALSFTEDSAPLAFHPMTLALLALSAIFLTEFTARCLDAESRKNYLRKHWLDLVTSIPLIGPLRLLRVLRLLRLLRLALGFRSVARANHGRASEDLTWLVWPFVLLFWFTSAYALWLTEHGVNPAITNFGGALYVAFLTASTVGYGGSSPVTGGGKIVGGLIVFVAIGLVGFTSARLTAMFLEQRETDSAVPRALGGLEREVHELRELLESIAAGLPLTDSSVDASVRPKVRS